MKIRQQNWMRQHNRAASIQVTGTNEIQEKSKFAKVDQKRASTVMRGVDGTTQNDSEQY